jgi:hypothetical protein
MKKIVILTLSMMIFLAWQSKTKDPRAQIPFFTTKKESLKDLMIRKAELRAEFYKARLDQMVSVYPRHDKHVLEAELNYKLQVIDLEMAKLGHHDFLVCEKEKW